METTAVKKARKSKFIFDKNGRKRLRGKKLRGFKELVPDAFSLKA